MVVVVVVVTVVVAVVVMITITIPNSNSHTILKLAHMNPKRSMPTYSPPAPFATQPQHPIREIKALQGQT